MFKMVISALISVILNIFVKSGKRWFSFYDWKCPCFIGTLICCINWFVLFSKYFSVLETHFCRFYTYASFNRNSKNGRNNLTCIILTIYYNFTTFDFLKREIINRDVIVARFARKSLYKKTFVFETHGNSVAMRIFIPFCPFMHLSYFLGK